MHSTALDTLAECIRTLRDAHVLEAARKALAATSLWADQVNGRDHKRAANKVRKAVDQACNGLGFLADRLSLTYGLAATAEETRTPGFTVANRLSENLQEIGDLVRPLVEALADCPLPRSEDAQQHNLLYIPAITGAGRAGLDMADRLGTAFVEAYGEDEAVTTAAQFSDLRRALDRLETLTIPPVAITVQLPPQRLRVLEDLGAASGADILVRLAEAALDPDLGPGLVAFLKHTGQNDEPAPAVGTPA
ncbi:hypothetical protein ACFVZ3_19195 [Kitasatospora purpeofusca]|uniref:hypothetical protein n=1 Tax=Kitasatospora purpeofusca TaxID=67352 RepID=UPI00369B9B73